MLRRRLQKHFSNSKACRTGDLKDIQDGMLFFDGRIDNQIKLYSYSIELGDVEARLSSRPDARDPSLLPVPKGGRVVSLRACVVLKERTARIRFHDCEPPSRPTGGAIAQAYMLPRTFHISRQIADDCKRKSQ